MKVVFNTKSATVVVIAASLCTATGYLIYTLIKRDDEDQDEDLNVKRRPSNFTEVETTVPSKLVGALIGRNGNNIKAIEDQTKTVIRFQQANENNYRLCIIRGTKEACNDAEVIIKEFIATQPQLENEDIMIPHEFVGKVIGRCGEEITEIIIRSGAKIVISNNSIGATRKISITGTRDQINTAKQNIEEIVEKCRAGQEYLEATLAKREPRLKSPSPRLTISENKQVERTPSPNFISQNSQVESLSPLLGKSDTQYVYVSAVEDPSQFWIQIVGTKAAELDKLVEKMTEYYNNEETKMSHSLNSVQIGDRVAAIFDFDKKWYRAEVIGLPTEEEPSIELFYMDYGDYNIVPLNDICSLRTDFLELNFQAIECCLSKIEPIGGKWSAEAIDLFVELAQVAKWRKLVAVLDNYSEQPKSDGSPVPGISLYDNSGYQSIAEALVNNGYAVFKEQRIYNGNANIHGDNECIEVNE